MNGALTIRNFYMARFAGRCMILAACFYLCLLKPVHLKVLEGFSFFKDITVLHILWAVWMINMILQLIPVKWKMSIGSQKYFGRWYQPAPIKPDRRALKKYTVSSGKRAFLVFLLWTALIAVLGILHHMDILQTRWLFFASVVFYVCDLICVLFWCPFRLILGNRCCTTCRIFNWDHLMMFTPFLFIPGFFTWSLLAMAVIVWAVWEISAFLHPERFWEGTNDVLKCTNCTDKLCTQYCEKGQRYIIDKGEERQ